MLLEICHDHIHLLLPLLLLFWFFRTFLEVQIFGSMSKCQHGCRIYMRYTKCNKKKIQRDEKSYEKKNERRNHFRASLKQIMNVNWIEFLTCMMKKKIILHREIEQTNHQ